MNQQYYKRECIKTAVLVFLISVVSIILTLRNDEDFPFMFFVFLLAIARLIYVAFCLWWIDVHHKHPKPLKCKLLKKIRKRFVIGGSPGNYFIIDHELKKVHQVPNYREPMSYLLGDILGMVNLANAFSLKKRRAVERRYYNEWMRKMDDHTDFITKASKK